MGNRLTQVTQSGTNHYVYDDANRLTGVDGVTYTWDDKGNLLDDGTRTYTYDHANRLVSLVQGADTYTFAYNGLGDRLSQTVNAATTEYTLDLEVGLTQVLVDGTNTYLYGVGRIAESTASGVAYHLPAVLGTVRQLSTAGSEVAMAQSFAPFGGVLQKTGSATTSYGFTGEWTDATDLIHLRARYLDPIVGRFISRDTWSGVHAQPQTLNRWNYAVGNPINNVDPSGHCVRWSWAPSSNPKICIGGYSLSITITPGEILDLGIGIPMMLPNVNVSLVPCDEESEQTSLPITPSATPIPGSGVQQQAQALQRQRLVCRQILFLAGMHWTPMLS